MPMQQFPDGARGFSPVVGNKKATATLGSDEQKHIAASFSMRDSAGQSVAKVAEYQLIYGLQYDGWWELSYGRSNKSAPLRVSTAEAEEKDSRIWFEHGFYMGLHPTQAEVGKVPDERINVKAALAPPDAAKASPGDIVFNKKPTTHVGWVCVETTVGKIKSKQWKLFGKIE